MSPAIDLYIYHQHPAVSRGHLRLNFAVAEVDCPARRGIGTVPFIGAGVAPDGPEHHIGVECVHFFGSAVCPEVAAQPDGEGFAAIGEFLEVRALAVVGIRLSVVLPADADALYRASPSRSMKPKEMAAAYFRAASCNWRMGAESSGRDISRSAA